MDLTAQAILEADDSSLEPLEVPEWNGTVYVRAMTSAEKDAYDRLMVRIGERGQTAVNAQRLDNVRALLAVRVLCDKDGGRLFKDTDAAALGKKSSKALQRVWDVARKLSGFDEEETEKDAEAFGEAQGDDSSSE